MYSRNYSMDESTLRIPERYDGTALSERSGGEARQPIPDHTGEIKISPREEEAEPTGFSSDENRMRDFARLPVFLRKLVPSDLKIGVPTLGTEELLIGAVALCVLFSHDADILGALMLLALIFIT